MMRQTSKPIVCSATYEIDVAVPYRLDLTVSVLRRLSTNMVDVLTQEGQYVRAFDGFGGPVIARVTQKQHNSLQLTLDGDLDEHPRVLELIRRMLGVDRDLRAFNRAASRISWLRPLASRMRGVKPPRYPTLWEACVNAVVFQQVSLHAATAILRKMILAAGAPPLTYEGSTFHSFPSVESVQLAEDDALLAAGLSGRKLATLRRLGDALLSGMLDENMLEERASPDAVELLCRVKGIGPWTATVILLRGLGRLDVFPMNDSSVTRNLALVAGDSPLDIEQLLRALGVQKGMLYYHLLLARLEVRDDLGRASVYQ
jgi:DNA-3-methyladenine glycosylase II